jgi:YqaJ-like viral recombinase domain
MKQPTPNILDLFIMIIEFKKTSSRPEAEQFLQFAKQEMTIASCEELQNNTDSQSQNETWHRVRYGRITASRFYEVSQCKTEDGTLVEGILGGVNFKPTKYTQRGLRLESEVRELLKLKYSSLQECGIFLSPDYPIFGASPDAISEEFVFEIKSPAKEATVKNYITKTGHPTNKVKAQMMLQMLLTGRQKGILCVADPDFENNNSFQEIGVDFDSNFCNTTLKRCEKF